LLPEKFENAALFLRLGIPLTYNNPSRKRSFSKTLSKTFFKVQTGGNADFHFLANGKHFDIYEAFLKGSCDFPERDFLKDKLKMTVIVVILLVNYSGVVRKGSLIQSSSRLCLVPPKVE